MVRLAGSGSRAIDGGDPFQRSVYGVAMSTHAFDPDPLDDICPICGGLIKEADEWTRISVLEEPAIVHVACAESPHPADSRGASK